MIDTSTAALRKLADQSTHPLRIQISPEHFRELMLTVAAEKEVFDLLFAARDENKDAKEAQQPTTKEVVIQRQRDRMNSRFENRPPSKQTADFDLPQPPSVDDGIPNDVPLPSHCQSVYREGWIRYTEEAMHQYAEAYAKAAVDAAIASKPKPAPVLLTDEEMREALELIAAPKRPDGTWNRDREACRQLAAEALGRYDEKQKGM